jgi:hypothetical protein
MFSTADLSLHNHPLHTKINSLNDIDFESDVGIYIIFSEVLIFSYVYDSYQHGNDLK